MDFGDNCQSVLKMDTPLVDRVPVSTHRLFIKVVVAVQGQERKYRPPSATQNPCASVRVRIHIRAFVRARVRACQTPYARGPPLWLRNEGPLLKEE